MLTLIHAEPSDRSIWLGASAVFVLLALGRGTFAGSGASLLFLLASVACGLVAARRAAHQVLLDQPARALVLREISFAGDEDRRIPRDEIASFDCVPAGLSRAGVRSGGAAYRLRMTLVSGEGIALTKAYAVPDAGGTPWRDIAPFQAALALGHGLDVPINGLDPWLEQHRPRGSTG
jgi:hypothetical protein